MPIGNPISLAQRCSMPLTLEQIVEETRQWPDAAVAELIDRIVIAKHGGLDASHAAEWGRGCRGSCCGSGPRSIGAHTRVK
jgi:hypothetical protein